MDHRFPGEEPAAGHVPTQGKRGCWGAHVIRREPARFVPTRCRLRAQDFARHAARRPARGAADQVRPDCQPQDSESTWAHDPGIVPSARRRGDRVMRRRDFVTLIGSAAAWSLAARAQQPAMPMIGFLNARARAAFAPRLGAFWRGLSESGYAEGRNVAIEYRWAEGQYDRLPAMAADLVRRHATVIAAFGPPAALAAKAATATIPIVFVSGSDPVQAGLVASLNRPGGNVTGVYLLIIGLEEKRLSLLRDLVPKAGLIGILINPRSPDGQAQSTAMQAAARAVGQQILVVEASNDAELDAAFAALVQHRAGALAVTGDMFFNAGLERIVGLPARHAIPAIHSLREFAVAGGLMSYGTNVVDAYYQNGVYVGRILKGAKAADLPVEQSTKFEFVINLKAAKALGLEIPPGLSAIADEVIE